MPKFPELARRSAWVLVAPSVLLTLLLAGWQVYCQRAHPDPTVLPSPGRVLRQGWLNRADLLSNCLPTLTETVTGFALSVVCCWLLATVIDFSRPARLALYPFLVASQTVPIIAVAPLLIIWFGFGILPKVLVVAVTTFFPMTVALATGLASTDAQAGALLRSMAASPVAQFRRLRVPTALPYFFTGVRISASYAVISAVFAEYVGAERGLGIYLQSQQHAFRTDLVLAAVLVISALSIGLFAIAVALQWLLVPWQRPVPGGRQADGR